MEPSSIPEPHSCKHCQKLVVRFDENEKCIFDVTVPEMFQAFAQGCDLFNHLLFSGSIGDIPETSSLVASLEGLGEHLSMRIIESGETINLQHPENDFTVFADAGNKASKEIIRRPVNRFPTSEQSLESAKNWLHTCLTTHDICPKPDGKFMPTRLIAISNVREPDHLILLERPDPEPYAALSYCWGRWKQVTTTTNNLQRHKNILSFRDLPATVQDAITVVSKLGIRRLWIDSLCIIQDNADDKAREIAQMPLIYSQAMVTIAASSAHSVHEGFLSDRSLHPGFELPYQCDNGEEGSIILVPEVIRFGELTEPLESRGWTFQERLLSPRILDYRTYHTEWNCRENKQGCKFTDGAFDFSRDRWHNDDFAIFSEAILEEGDTPSGNCLSSTAGKYNADDIFRLWYRFIATYTLRDLTISSDKILAISAIANRFQPFLNDEYCAGHWKSRLDKELLWTADFSYGLKPRPSQYQAPSWSWASISSPVCAIYMYIEDSDGFSKQSDDCFEILDCQIRLRGEDERHESTELYRFGAVTSGTLVVKGRMRRGTLWRTQSGLAFKIETYERRGAGGALYWPHINCDAIEEEFANEPYGPHRNIRIFVLRVTQHPRQVGLILRQKGPSVYSRIGTIVFDIEAIESRIREQHWDRDPFPEEVHWLDAGEVRTITII